MFIKDKCDNIQLLCEDSLTRYASES